MPHPQSRQLSVSNGPALWVSLLLLGCGPAEQGPGASDEGSRGPRESARSPGSADAPRDFERGRKIIQEHMASPSHEALRTAVRHLEGATVADPKNVQYRLWAARAHELLLNNDQALEHYRVATQGGYDEPVTWRRVGVLALNMGEAEEARAAFERSLQLDATDPETFFGLGCLLDQEEELERASEAFERATELRPTYDDAYYRHAQILRALGDEAGAARAEAQFQHWNELDKELLGARKAARLAPGDLDAVRALGLLYFQLQNAADARTWLQRALELNPEDPLSLEHLGKILHIEGDLKGAETLLRRALATGSRAAESQLELAFVMLDGGRAEEARGHMEEALKLSGADPEMHYQKGVLLLMLDLAPLALEPFEQALALDASHIEAHLGRAQVLYGNGDLDGARMEYQEVLLLDPGNVGAASSLEFLAEKGEQ